MDQRTFENHHHVIYASESDRTVAFETMLLEDGESSIQCNFTLY